MADESTPDGWEAARDGERSIVAWSYARDGRAWARGVAVHQFEATDISEDSLHDIFSGLD
jgi:hypothetical protein